MNNYSNLVERAKNGDNSAFKELYDLTSQKVWFSSLKLVKNEDIAKDILQDTYLTASQKLNTLSNAEKFPQWVIRIAVNKSKDYFKKTTELSIDEEFQNGVEEITDEQMLPDDYVDSEEKRKIIINIIDTILSDVQRQTVIMFYFDQLSVSEISEMMECNTGTVTNRLSMARDKIRKAVLDYEDKNNDKLHGIMGIPFLTKLLDMESKKYYAPKIKLPNLTLNSAPSDIPQDTHTQTMTDTAAKTAQTGGKAMLNTIKTKVIAGVLSLAVIGGITAAVILNNNKDNAVQTNDKPKVTTNDKSDDDNTKTSSEIVNDEKLQYTSKKEEMKDVDLSKLDPQYVALIEYLDKFIERDWDYILEHTLNDRKYRTGQNLKSPEIIDVIMDMANFDYVINTDNRITTYDNWNTLYLLGYASKPADYRYIEKQNLDEFDYTVAVQNSDNMYRGVVLQDITVYYENDMYKFDTYELLSAVGINTSTSRDKFIKKTDIENGLINNTASNLLKYTFFESEKNVFTYTDDYSSFSNFPGYDVYSEIYESDMSAREILDYIYNNNEELVSLGLVDEDEVSSFINDYNLLDTLESFAQAMEETGTPEKAQKAHESVEIYQEILDNAKVYKTTKVSDDLKGEKYKKTQIAILINSCDYDLTGIEFLEPLFIEENIYTGYTVLSMVDSDIEDLKEQNGIEYSGLKGVFFNLYYNIS